MANRHPISEERKAARQDIGRLLGWKILSAFLRSPCSFSEWCSEAHMEPEKLRRLIWKEPERLKLNQVSDLCRALGCELDFALRQKGEFRRRAPRHGPFWHPRDRRLRWRPRETSGSQEAYAWSLAALPLAPPPLNDQARDDPL